MLFRSNHGLEDQIQNKNRVRPCGRTLPSQFTILFVGNNRELHIANKLLRIALLVKLAIKATDNSDMYSREFPTGGNFLFFVVCMMSLFRLPCGKLAFAQRSGAMKAPVGLLSDRTVLRKQDGGALPRQVTAGLRSEEHTSELQSHA